MSGKGWFDRFIDWLVREEPRPPECTADTYDTSWWGTGYGHISACPIHGTNILEADKRLDDGGGLR